MEEFLLIGYGQFASRSEGAYILYDGRIYYYLEREIHEQAIPYAPETTYINHVAFKGNLMVANTINRYIIIGTR